jgi:hypothetical protein
MSIGTIFLIILVLILLGGFSGLGAARSTGPAITPWRVRPRDCDSFDLGFARQNLKTPPIIDDPAPHAKKRSQLAS